MMNVTPAPTGIVLAVETRALGDARVVVETDTRILKAVSRESARDRFEIEVFYLTPEQVTGLLREFGGAWDNLLAHRVPMSTFWKLTAARAF